MSPGHRWPVVLLPGGVFPGATRISGAPGGARRRCCRPGQGPRDVRRRGGPAAGLQPRDRGRRGFVASRRRRGSTRSTSSATRRAERRRWRSRPDIPSACEASPSWSRHGPDAPARPSRRLPSSIASEPSHRWRRKRSCLPSSDCSWRLMLSLQRLRLDRRRRGCRRDWWASVGSSEHSTPSSPTGTACVVPSAGLLRPGRPEQSGPLCADGLRLSRVFSDFTLDTFASRHHFDPPHRVEPARLARALRELWARPEASDRLPRRTIVR